MKKIINLASLFILFAVCLNSCVGTAYEPPCQMFIYRAYSPHKVYRISFNGKDSIETVCGEVNWDKFFTLIDEKRFNSKAFHFDTIFLKKQELLPEELRDTLLETLRTLNSKIVADTVFKYCRDEEYFYLSLEKQDICQSDSRLKDEDLIKFYKKLIEYSPIYINRCHWHWRTLEMEKISDKYCKGEITPDEYIKEMRKEEELEMKKASRK